jgi:E3 ubiquitin-protein ligase RNF146
MSSESSNTDNIIKDDEDICVICIDKPVNPFTLPCKHFFCYMCIKRVTSDLKPCPSCNAIIPEFVLEKAKVSNEIIKLEEISSKWLYSGRNSGWWYYSKEYDEIIEESWNKYKNLAEPGVTKSYVNINILGRNYKIDFYSMTQIANSGEIRSIKRIDQSEEENIIVKGITGLQIVKNEHLPTLPPPIWRNPDEYLFNPNAWNSEDDEEIYSSNSSSNEE